MSFLDSLRAFFGGRPRKRKSLLDLGSLEALDQNRVVTTVILVLVVAAIVLISFVGIDSSTIPIFPNQISTVQITASVPFDFVSRQKTEDNRELIRTRVSRIYTLDTAPLAKFEDAVSELLANLETLEQKYPPAAAPAATATPAAAPAALAAAAAPATSAPAPANVATQDSGPKTPDSGLRTPDSALPDAQARLQSLPPAALDDIVATFNARGPYHATADEILALFSLGDARSRRAYIETAVLTLREIYNDGIEDGSATISGNESIDGEAIERRMRTLGEARYELRVNLAAERTGRKAARLLGLFFDNALVPNLIFDAGATERHIAEAIEKLPPATVHVERGQTIIANGARVTSAQYEMLEAYRAWLHDHVTVRSTADMLIFRRILLVLAMVLACGLYIRIKDGKTLESNGRLALLAIVVVANLALVRLTYWMSELPYFVHHSSAASMLPYLAPAAIAPIIVAILIDVGPAIVMALFISLFTSVIYGNRLDVLVFSFFASVIAVSCSRHVRSRGSIMRAAFNAGIAVAGFALLFGIIDQQAFWLPDLTVPRQILAALASGILTGIIVIGTLPLIENLFKRTTDITLLELTDYNRPLLRRMQMDAPGTYHHSLVVAQLAENAAAATDANPLLARVCALYHDIGKLKHPEYFSENQRDRANPHDENNPSLSALIIKSHVKDGVDLAIKEHLPRAIIDVIQQHHGTGLIRYFYQRAVSEHRAQVEGANSHSPLPAAPAPANGNGGNARASLTRPPFPVPPGAPRAPFPPHVSETTYRSAGPPPPFKESAIIHLADGVEAASRTLRKITPHNLGELIDKIVKERVDDGQLAEAPITFEDLTKIKNSFALTLLNMLHSRVAYPPAAGEAEAAPAPAAEPRTNSEPAPT